MDGPSTVPGSLAWIEPLSVPFLVSAAILGVWWERRRDAQRRDGFDAEVSAYAYALRRQMREWPAVAEESGREEIRRLVEQCNASTRSPKALRRSFGMSKSSTPGS